jgi:hypothetical protein
MRTFFAAVVAMVLTASSVAALGGMAGAGTADPGSGVPDLVGTWTGTYRYASGNDEVVDATETLVIERQKDRLIWGTDDYVEGGQTIKIPVRGSIGRDGRGFTIAEEGGYFLGEILGRNRVHVWFVRVDDQFTTFEAVLRRSK